MFVTLGLFASDAITIGDRLTINAGVRFDHSRAISQDLPVLERRETKPDATSRGWARCTPGTSCRRVWAHAKLTGDGRTILRGSYGDSAREC